MVLSHDRSKRYLQDKTLLILRTLFHYVPAHDNNYLAEVNV